MQCYYELLNVALDASDLDIKRAYRIQALAMHPDKNPGRVHEATAEFTQIQEAYEVLSNQNEKAWYDRHRTEILRESALVVESCINKEYLLPFFSTSCYAGMGGDLKGFFGVYQKLFMEIVVEERLSCENDTESITTNYSNDVDGFGGVDTEFEPSLKRFYAFWAGFTTCQSFSRLDEYKLHEIDDRRIRRIAEQKNKKKRELARRELNETVKNLVSIIKKRDPRYKKHLRMLEERSHDAQKKLSAQQEYCKSERIKQAKNYEEAEWTKIKDQNSNDAEINESVLSLFECIVCSKIFKSDNQLQSHENSKKHKSAIEALKSEMMDDDLNIFGELSIEDLGHASFDKADKLNLPLEVNEYENIKADFESTIITPFENTNTKMEPSAALSENISLIPGERIKEKSEPRKSRRAPKEKRSAASAPVKLVCNDCSLKFKSRTQLFAHINSTGHAKLDFAKSKK